MLRLYTGPAHAPLQFFLRRCGGQIWTCNGRPYYVHFAGDRRYPAHALFELDLAHRAATGAERCVRCHRPRREHSRQALHDWTTSVSVRHPFLSFKEGRALHRCDTCQTGSCLIWQVLCSALEKLSMWSPPCAAYRPHREDETPLPTSFVPAAAEGSRPALACGDLGVLSATREKQVRDVGR